MVPLVSEPSYLPLIPAKLSIIISAFFPGMRLRYPSSWKFVNFSMIPQLLLMMSGSQRHNAFQFSLRQLSFITSNTPRQLRWWEMTPWWASSWVWSLTCMVRRMGSSLFANCLCFRFASIEGSNPSVFSWKFERLKTMPTSPHKRLRTMIAMHGGGKRSPSFLSCLWAYSTSCSVLTMALLKG